MAVISPTGEHDLSQGELSQQLLGRSLTQEEARDVGAHLIFRKGNKIGAGEDCLCRSVRIVCVVLAAGTMPGVCVREREGGTEWRCDCLRVLREGECGSVEIEKEGV